MATPDRQSYIDVFRGIAVLVVVLFHYTERVPGPALGYEETPLSGLFTWGWIGPYWFFVISGFCMPASLERAQDAVAFLAKRVSRIYPAYFAAVFLILGFTAIFGQFIYPAWNFNAESISVLDVAANLVFATDLGFNLVDGAFWTLLIELKFYLFLSLLLVLAHGRNTNWIARVVSWAAFPLGCVWVALHILSDGLSIPAPGLRQLQSALNVVLIAPYLPFFALGLLALQFSRRRTLGLAVSIGAMFGLTCIVVSTFSSDLIYPNESFVVSTGVYAAGTMIFFFVPYMSSAILAPLAGVLGTPLVRIGTISYGWYLVHQDIGITVIHHLTKLVPDWIALISAMLFTYLLGELLRVSVEWRFRRQVESVFSRIARWLLPPYRTKPPGNVPEKSPADL